MAENENTKAFGQKLLKVSQQVQSYLKLHGDKGLEVVALVAFGMEALTKNKLALAREIESVGSVAVGERTRVQVEMTFQIADTETLSSMKCHWYGDSALGISEAVRSSETSFLLHTFGVGAAMEPIYEQPARQQSQPAKASSNGNGQRTAVAGSYKDRSGDFFTLLSKSLKAIGQPSYQKDMLKLVELFERDGALKPETEYKAAVEIIVGRIKAAAEAK